MTSWPALLAAALLLLGGRATAATVTGSLKSAANVALTNATVRFSPVDAPLAAAPDVIAAGDVLVTTDSVGAYSQTLAAGNYKVTLPNSRFFAITVPTGDGTYSVLDLVTGGLRIGGNYVPGGPSTVPLATTNVAGKLFAYSLSTNPVVYLRSDVDTLLTAAASSNQSNLDAATNSLTSALNLVGTRATNAIPSTNGVAYTGLTIDGQLYNRTNDLIQMALTGSFIGVTNTAYDSYRNLTNATVTWRNGASGRLTALGSSRGITNLSVTYIAGGSTNTITFPAIVKNPDGTLAYSLAPTFQ